MGNEAGHQRFSFLPGAKTGLYNLGVLRML